MNGHKHHKGDKVVAICDRNCDVITPFIKAPGNRNEIVLLAPALDNLISTARNIGIDIKGARIWKGAKDSTEQELNNVCFVRTQIELIDKIFEELQ